MNEMLFSLNHYEKVKYKGNPSPNCLIEGDLKGGHQIIFWSSRNAKNAQNYLNAFLTSISENDKHIEIYRKGNPGQICFWNGWFERGPTSSSAYVTFTTMSIRFIRERLSGDQFNFFLFVLVSSYVTGVLILHLIH